MCASSRKPSRWAKEPATADTVVLVATVAPPAAATVIAFIRAWGTARLIETSPSARSQVLEYPDIGGFEVETVGDPNADAMRATIGGFLDTRTADDVVLLYLSGHGVWSREVGQLYFAACDTDQDRLSETGVSAEFVLDVVSREIVLAQSVAGRPLRLKPLAPASRLDGSVGNDMRPGRSVRSPSPSLTRGRTPGAAC
jgi:hypothetical protein